MLQRVCVKPGTGLGPELPRTPPEHPPDGTDPSLQKLGYKKLHNQQNPWNIINESINVFICHGKTEIGQINERFLKILRIE